MPIQIGNITLYSLEELSKTLKVTKITLRAYLKEEEIRGRKLAGRWYVSEKSLRVFFNPPEREPWESDLSDEIIDSLSGPSNAVYPTGEDCKESTKIVLGAFCKQRRSKK